MFILSSGWLYSKSTEAAWTRHTGLKTKMMKQNWMSFDEKGMALRGDGEMRLKYNVWNFQRINKNIVLKRLKKQPNTEKLPD